ncbi:MAG: PhnD/SsuA/transferrin family substrate-binding protein [Halopenitus sp.]
MSPDIDADVSDVSRGIMSTEPSGMSRRRFIAAGAGVAGATGLAGCSGVLGNSASSSSKKEVTILLTPENPTEVKKDYMPMKKYLEDEISNLDITYRVPTDYSAILPALKSKQAEIGMDDITLIAASDEMEVMGTAITGGTAFYFSLMMTRKDTDIKKPADVKGKKMAFADALSTSGSIYALYELQQAGLDIGEAPGSDEGADFQGTWSNHKAALESLINGKADACSTWGGNGMPYVPTDEVPKRVREKTAYMSETGSKKPALDVFLYSAPIPKQPVYNRATWDDPMRDKIRQKLLDADEQTMNKYKPDDYGGTMPFTKLKDTTVDHYQPVIKRVNELGIDLTQG